MEALILLILILIQFKKFKLRDKFKDEGSIYIKSFLIILGLGAIYLAFRTAMDLSKLGSSVNISYYKPLLIELRNVSAELLAKNENVLAGWAIVGLKTYQYLLMTLALITLTLIFSRSKKSA
ncbi:hypothetical protein [Neofamilia massiliensis]|uniref:hypothetical protein n=1 Tax=Neofamilia massiliensis TaxID=1673724 RepID=UPI0006BB9514|nr:hypothetical protein [Neofamilia massiliensis]